MYVYSLDRKSLMHRAARERRKICILKTRSRQKQKKDGKEKKAVKKEGENRGNQVASWSTHDHRHCHCPSIRSLSLFGDGDGVQFGLLSHSGSSLCNNSHSTLLKLRLSLSLSGAIEELWGTSKLVLRSMSFLLSFLTRIYSTLCTYGCIFTLRTEHGGQK